MTTAARAGPGGGMLGHQAPGVEEAELEDAEEEQEDGQEDQQELDVHGAPDVSRHAGGRVCRRLSLHGHHPQGIG
jgi:hypothetical protein